MPAHETNVAPKLVEIERALVEGPFFCSLADARSCGLAFCHAPRRLAYTFSALQKVYCSWAGNRSNPVTIACRTVATASAVTSDASRPLATHMK